MVEDRGLCPPEVEFPAAHLYPHPWPGSWGLPWADVGESWGLEAGGRGMRAEGPECA